MTGQSFDDLQREIAELQAEERSQRFHRPKDVKTAANLTQADWRWLRERHQHLRIDNSLRFVKKTGRCPVCRTAPSAYGITCGARDCVVRWLGDDHRGFNSVRHEEN